MEGGGGAAGAGGELKRVEMVTVAVTFFNLLQAIHSSFGMSFYEWSS